MCTVSWAIVGWRGNRRPHACFSVWGDFTCNNTRRHYAHRGLNEAINIWKCLALPVGPTSSCRAIPQRNPLGFSTGVVKKCGKLPMEQYQWPGKAALEPRLEQVFGTVWPAITKASSATSIHTPRTTFRGKCSKITTFHRSIFLRTRIPVPTVLQGHVRRCCEQSHTVMRLLRLSCMELASRHRCAGCSASDFEIASFLW